MLCYPNFFCYDFRAVYFFYPMKEFFSYVLVNLHVPSATWKFLIVFLRLFSFLKIWNKIFSFLITLFKISQLLHPTRRHIVENVEFGFWIWPNEAWLLSLYRRWITDSLRIADTETIKFLDLGFYNRPDHPVKIISTNLLRQGKSFWSKQISYKSPR